jgi:hypothetical protein
MTYFQISARENIDISAFPDITVKGHTPDNHITASNLLLCHSISRTLYIRGFNQYTCALFQGQTNHRYV